MPNENNPNEPRDTWKESAENEIAKKQRMEQARIDTIHRLRTDPQIQAFLQQFSVYSQEQFIKTYAIKLQSVLEHGPFYVQMAEQATTEYMKRAEACLEQIQLKKLYDMRLQWGAYMLTIEGINTAADFVPHRLNIMNSPVVPPISQDEFDLYYEYAQSPSFAYTGDINFIGLVNAHNMGDEPELPDWFMYHNTHTGSGMHMMLPDTRGQKEMYYRNVWSAKQQELREVQQATNAAEAPVRDNRPMISSTSYEQVLVFMEAFETPETVRMFETSELYNASLLKEEDDEDDDTMWLNEQVESIMVNLQSLPDVILPVEANADWRRALVDAWDLYEKEQTIACLPVAYDNYCFMQMSGISYKDKEFTLQKECIQINEDILNARELLGEERSFDY